MNNKKKACDSNNKEKPSYLSKKTTPSDVNNKDKLSDINDKETNKIYNALKAKPDKTDQELLYKETDKLFNDDITDLSWGLAPLANGPKDLNNIDDFFDTRIDIGDGLSFTDMDNLSSEKEKAIKNNERCIGDNNRVNKSQETCGDDKAYHKSVEEDMELRTNSPALERITHAHKNVINRDCIKLAIVSNNMGIPDADHSITDDAESEKNWDILNKPSVWHTDVSCYKQSGVIKCQTSGTCSEKNVDDNDADEDDDFSYETFPSDTDFTLFDNEIDEDKTDTPEIETNEQKSNNFSRIIKTLKNAVVNK